MTKQPLPENWQELIAGYVLGNLSVEESEQLEILLQNHPQLRVEIEESENIANLLSAQNARSAAPPQLRSKIISVQENRIANPTRERQVRPSKNRSLIWKFAVALGLIYFGWQNYILSRQLEKAQLDLFRVRQQLEESQAILAKIEESNPRYFNLEGVQPVSEAYGTAAFAPDAREAFLVVENLPPLPEEQIYRIWARIEEFEQPVFCGQFQTNDKGHDSKVWITPELIANSSISEIFITAESVESSPQAPGVKVMESTSYQVQ